MLSETRSSTDCLEMVLDKTKQANSRKARWPSKVNDECRKDLLETQRRGCLKERPRGGRFFEIKKDERSYNSQGKERTTPWHQKTKSAR